MERSQKSQAAIELAQPVSALELRANNFTGMRLFLTDVTSDAKLWEIMVVDVFGSSLRRELRTLNVFWKFLAWPHLQSLAVKNF